MNTEKKVVRVLLSNDDGPPSSQESPFVVPFVEELERTLGWKVKVILPSSQKSWISKAFLIKEELDASFIYVNRDGSTTSPSYISRGLREDERREIILLDGTPASCVNIGIHHFCEEEGVDLVLTGPNLGRNTSSAFALSSGTIGGAMEGATCRIPSIAISYGVIKRPFSDQLVCTANRLAVKVVEQLWNTWYSKGGAKDSGVALYNLNIPLDENLSDSSPVKWTRIHRSHYGRLFHTKKQLKVHSDVGSTTSREVGPGAVSDTQANAAAHTEQSDPSYDEGEGSSKDKRLTFVFAPDIAHLIKPDQQLPQDTDAFAMQTCTVSVTALQSSFAEVPLETASKIVSFGSD